jgi:hypothetical protein
MPTLGPSLDGFVQTVPTAALGPSLDGFIKTIPSTALGPSLDGFIDAIPGSSLGPGLDGFPDFIPDLGVRGPQIEPYDLELDRLTNITSAALATVAGIDLTSIATTALFTATQKTYVLGVILRVSTADTVTGVAEASVGVNPSADDVFANEQLVNLDQVGDLYSFWGNAGTGTILNTSDQLDLSVNTGATATSLVAVAYVIGVLLN